MLGGKQVIHQIQIHLEYARLPVVCLSNKLHWFVESKKIDYLSYLLVVERGQLPDKYY